MKITSYIPSAKTAITTAIVATMLVSIVESYAQVVFDDGNMHTINDATYASERIEVRNGTKLKIVDGAEISASVGPEFEFAIQVFDNSVVIIHGGVFGGDLFPIPTVPAYANNWFAGSIAAFDQSLIVVKDGTFGKDAFRSGMFAIYDEAHLNISGGKFTNDGGSGGRIETFGNAHVNISAGLFGATINSMENSSINISGGEFGKDNFGGRPLFYRGSVSALGNSIVRISGGNFGVGTGFVIFSGALLIQDAANVKISGGSFSGDANFGNGVVLVQSGDAKANISGGFFDGTEIHVEAGEASIEGCAFNLPFGPVNDLSATLQGVLSSGDVIDVTLTRDGEEAIIDLVEDCDL
jgi:hypothetical protein